MKNLRFNQSIVSKETLNCSYSSDLWGGKDTDGWIHEQGLGVTQKQRGLTLFNAHLEL